MTTAPESYWQDFEQTDLPAAERDPNSWEVRLEDGRRLLLPIRRLADGEHGLASLIINQASFAVQQKLCELLAASLRPFAPEVVVGLPTLGLTVAAGVAQALGHTRYVPLGTSRKFWYDEKLSATISSVTTAEPKRLYIDPRLMPLIAGRRVALIDDVLSTGRSIVGGLALLEQVGVVPVCVGALMLQTQRWREAVAPSSPDVVGVFRTPLLRWTHDEWEPGETSSL